MTAAEVKKMSKPWMPFYGGDYLADTSRLSLAEHGAYLLLILDYWNSGPLPALHEQCYRIASASTEHDRIAVDNVLLEFFTKTGGGYHHKRIDKERASAQERYEKRAEAARKRWSKEPTNDAKHDALDDAMHGANGDALDDTTTTTTTTTSTTKKKTCAPEGAVSEIFSYWQSVMAHPKAKLDDKRRRKIRDRLKDGYTVDDLKMAIDGCKVSPHHQGKNDTGTVYDDIELICRDSPKVDQFLKALESKPRGLGPLVE